MSIPISVLAAYGLDKQPLEQIAFGTGLINYTWKINAGERAYILQCINQEVFKNPVDIASNIQAVGDYLHAHFPQYLFVMPVPALDGKSMVFAENKYYRLFPFVNGSHAKTVVDSTGTAYEAAKQFGRFTKLLSGFDAGQLKISLPHFHDLSFRYQAFQEALQNGNPSRIAAAATLIKEVQNHAQVVTTYEQIIQNPLFKKRVTHHDTKISNVLFDASDKGLCVIDLDTLMPGYFISDVGDMMRTYLSPVSEEEKDFSKIRVREDIYHSIVNGYFEEMQGELTEPEKNYFFYAARFMIYMQALRFLTDHFNNDSYYGAVYEGHNYIRAANQMNLYSKLMEKEKLLTA